MRPLCSETVTSSCNEKRPVGHHQRWPMAVLSASRIMLVDGAPPHVPAATTTPERQAGGYQQRSDGNPSSLSTLNLNDLPEAHRRQVMENLRILIQKTCPETIQHMVDKRMNISEVINVIKQKTNFTFFELTSAACIGEQLVCSNYSAHLPNTTFYHGLNGEISASNAHKLSNGHSGFDHMSLPIAQPFASLPTQPLKIAPPVLSLPSNISTVSPLDDAATSRIGSSEFVVAPTNSSAPLPAHLLVYTDMCHPTLAALNDTAFHSSDLLTAPQVKKRKRTARRPIVKSIASAGVFLADPPSASSIDASSLASTITSLASYPDSQQQVEPELPPISQDSAISAAFAETSMCDIGQQIHASLSKQYCRNTISNARRRRNNGAGQRNNHDWLHQRWRSIPGTIVTHYIALNSKDLLDCPAQDRLPLTNAGYVDAVMNENIMRISLSDCGNASGETDSDALLNDHDIALHGDNEAACVIKNSAKLRASSFSSQNHSNLSCSDAAESCEETHLPPDSVLLRMLERCYKLERSPDAACYPATNDKFVIMSNNKYPVACTVRPESSALIHSRMMKLLQQYFPNFDAGARFGTCELCKQAGLFDFWPASRRFCSSQCAKKYARQLQTEQSRLSPRKITTNEPRTLLNGGDITHSSTANDFATHVSPFKARSCRRRKRRLPEIYANQSGHSLPESGSSKRCDDTRAEQPAENSTAAIAAPTSGPIPFAVNSSILIALEGKHVDKWSEDEVAHYIAAFEFHVSPDIPRQFVRDGIDGQALLLLSMDMLTSTMHIPFGHALKINFAIEELRKNKGLVDMTKLRIPVQ